MIESAYPKEYTIWVCPPSGMEDYLPVYACADMSVHLEPGNCPSCGSKLSQIGAADASMYLATHELWA